MSSYLEMSLEDIIKKKKMENPRSNKNIKNVSTKKPIKPKSKMQPNKPTVVDARNKIISKKRTQITDAREKLTQLAKYKDARLKLEKLRQERQPVHAFRHIEKRRQIARIWQTKEPIFVDPSRQVVSQPLNTGRQTQRRQLNTKRFIENRFIGNRMKAVQEEMPRIKPITRTVENDLEIIDDPMEGNYVTPKMRGLQLKIITHNNDLGGSSTVHRTAITERAKSPPRPPSILKKRPMAALGNEKNKKSEKPVLEYRIIVSNLRSSVTAGDIEELFGDVGGMVESRLVRPGTAEVMYNSQEDAQRAVDLYHNRQLDGQPMTCLLVTPRSPMAPPRSSSKPELYSTNSNVEPDISTFHKVLFRHK